MSFNPIVFCSNLARAYEISKCGGHSLNIILVENADSQTLSGDDFEAIAEYFHLEELPNPDMYIELPKPDATEILRSIYHNNRYETIQDIDKRVEEFRSAMHPEFNEVLSTASESLLKTAISRLNLDITTVKKILAISKTIARMAGSDKRKPEHVAEAIHYQSIEKDFLK